MNIRNDREGSLKSYRWYNDDKKILWAILRFDWGIFLHFNSEYFPLSFSLTPFSQTTGL